MVEETHLLALENDGFCVVEDMLTAAQVLDVRTRLLAAALESERRGSPTHIPGLDPNDSNVRVFNLPDLDPVFLDLIQRPNALEYVRALIGDDFIISNFTANIARPGARSMTPHSDLSAVFPGPWSACWSMNIIWCLDDVYEANGATRYLPGSHRIEHATEVPKDMLDHMRPFEAKAGSVIVMDGRLWHTSGENITEDAERALLFGYYSAAFLRPQVNWSVLIAAETQRNLSLQMHHWLGLGPNANVVNADFVARARS